MSNSVVIANGLVKIGITSLLVWEKCGYCSGHAQIKCFFFIFRTYSCVGIMLKQRSV